MEEVNLKGSFGVTPYPTEDLKMSRRASLFALMASMGLVGAGYLSAFFPFTPPVWGVGTLLVGSVAGLLSVSFLGAGERAAARRLRLPLGLVFVLLVGGVGAGLLLPDARTGDPLHGGLPLPAALLLYGAGLLPLLVVPLAYAWTFQGAGMGKVELAELVARARAAGAGGGSPPGRGRQGGEGV